MRDVERCPDAAPPASQLSRLESIRLEGQRGRARGARLFSSERNRAAELPPWRKIAPADKSSLPERSHV
ncbi:hypothetical protein MPTK1_1g09450 [Marchantia polymorpha subsp. ruderalis]|uniref:Uncharacterized protein n=2 Tax=Marchantia polymorpha TaxID=3197 RepID=A0AAF6AN99_MARPO|nr:hypothetical protein MARPO_0096s0055 [Marchantia polymorpha]BBM97919.1 hypothetical protein Mp_1g09450 [Marchantia polymorpha subsp. ruderalis]|eukprot:PTQ32710.1 hypothetical protein MARPO_0096s0055 [Marchantia polymorpha]